MRPKLLYKNSLAVAAMALALLLVANSAFAQGSSFTYQGRLTDGGAAANGIYDLQFVLFDSASSGAQIGSTQTLNSVLVSAGVFSVTLDFGANSFNGANRFLEISARPSGAGSFTLLTPRQPVTATPYAIRSVNASAADALSSTCAGCVQDTQINSVSGNKVSGTAPNLRRMSIAAFKLVPAPSIIVSGRITNSSVSFDAIQVKRGDSFAPWASFPALTK